MLGCNYRVPTGKTAHELITLKKSILQLVEQKPHLLGSDPPGTTGAILHHPFSRNSSSL